MSNETKTILVVSPHPDDEAIGCGGAILHHKFLGRTVRSVYLTSGEKGGHRLSPVETGPLREAEARRAAEILGLDGLEFWRQPDGRLRVTQVLVSRLIALVRAWRVGLIYVPHAQEMHPDHRAAFRLVRRARRQVPSGTLRILGYEVWTPLQEMTEILDISSFVEKKIGAIQAHQSQCRVLRFDEAARGLARYRGEMHSWPGGDYAEVFREVEE